MTRDELLEAMNRAHYWLTVLSEAGSSMNETNAKALYSTVRNLFEACEFIDNETLALIDTSPESVERMADALAQFNLEWRQQQDKGDPYHQYPKGEAIRAALEIGKVQ